MLSFLGLRQTTSLQRAAGAALVLLLAAKAGACTGDCSGDGSVTVDELVLGVRIALEEAPVTQCTAMDANSDNTVDVPEIIQAVGAALVGCPTAPPSATPSHTPMPSSTPTVVPSSSPSATSPAPASATPSVTPSRTATVLVVPSGSPSPVGQMFTDVTEMAGVSYLQHHLHDPVDCRPLPLLANPGLLEMVLACVIERQTGGAAAGDYDNDGWLDLFVTRLDDSSILFRNRGDGTFEDVTAAAQLQVPPRADGAVWSDIDNDGDLDLYVTMAGADRYYLYINDGAGHFSEQAVQRGVAYSAAFNRLGMSVSTADYNLDGYLDLVVSEWRPDVFAPSDQPTGTRLLRNRGAAQPGYFDDVTESAGLGMAGSAVGDFFGPGTYGFTPAFIDFDQDNWPDLAAVSDIHGSRLFWNNHDGTFTDGTAAAHVGTDESGMGNTFADYDNDGDLDWFVTSIYCPTMPDAFECSGNRLYRNEGNRVFSDQTDAAGVRNGYWGWGADFFDFDNDGDQDLVQTDGWNVPVDDFDDQFNFDPMRLWRNDGGVMTEIAVAAGLTDTSSGKGLLTFDYDRDGDLDVFIVNNGGTPRLYRNDIGNRNGWLRVKVVGKGSNRSGLGARVRVIADGLAPQIQEINGNSRFLGQSESAAHFGLGPQHPATAEVQITWPRTGVVQVLHDVATDRELVVEEP